MLLQRGSPARQQISNSCPQMSERFCAGPHYKRSRVEDERVVEATQYYEVYLCKQELGFAFADADIRWSSQALTKLKAMDEATRSLFYQR